MLPLIDCTQVFTMRTYSKNLLQTCHRSIELTFNTKGFPLSLLFFTHFNNWWHIQSTLFVSGLQLQHVHWSLGWHCHISQEGFSKFPDEYWASGSQWCVGCCSTLSPSGTPTGSSLLGKDQKIGQAMGCSCIVRWTYLQGSTVYFAVYCLRLIWDENSVFRFWYSWIWKRSLYFGNCKNSNSRKILLTHPIFGFLNSF